MARNLAVLIVLALSLGSLPRVVMAAPTQFSPGAPGLGDPYFPRDGNGGYDVQHYLLDVTYEPSTDRLTGVATITANATQNLSSFNLDFVGLTVRSIEVDRKAASWARDAGELTITPKQGLLEGNRFVVIVRYDGVPETIHDAFGESGFLHTNDGALVVGEPHVAATWFPANDHPSDKAAFTFEITVPDGLEAVANGVLKPQRANGGPNDPGSGSSDGDGQNGNGQHGDGAWTTWTWDAVEPMATYLAGMGIGEFDVRAYQADGIKYWDAIDSTLLPDLAPPITAAAGDQFLYSQVGEPAYKRLTHTIDVPPGGASLSFRVNRDTEPNWDFLFVEARTAGGSDWTTLPDVNGHTSQETGACPGFLTANPFLAHYLTDVPAAPCSPTGTSGTWHAASGRSAGWENWVVKLENTGSVPRNAEVSITYASDFSVQGRGVVIDDIVSSTGQGTTSFVADSDPLDGWVAPIAGPEGSADNPNTWVVATFVPAIIGHGASALVSLDRQPEIIAFQAATFGPYPFSAAGGIVDAGELGFALENQTRPIYSEAFFGGPAGNDFVVVHELAHQWFGDNVALARWQHIWLNEGFATYAEWLWSEREGLGTAQEIVDFYSGIPADDPFWALVIGDPGPVSLFDFPVYGRGAMTLHALRLKVGDADFFEILREWARRHAGGNVTTDQFIRLAEEISGQDLGALFDAWLFTSGKPDVGAAMRRATTTGIGLKQAPAAVRSLAQRFTGPDQPFRDVAR